MFKIFIIHNSKERIIKLLSILCKYNSSADIEITLPIETTYELEYFVRNKECNLFIVDPNFICNNYNGIFLAERVKIINRKTMIVFISKNSDSDNLIQIINTEPFAYISENNIEKDLAKILDKAIYISNSRTGIFTYTKRSEKYSVILKNVVYFVSSHRIIKYISVDGREDYFYDKMDNIEKIIIHLSEDFVRINQSYLVNQKYIVSISGTEITMVNGHAMIISRKYHDKLNSVKENIINFNKKLR